MRDDVVVATVGEGLHWWGTVLITTRPDEQTEINGDLGASRRALLHPSRGCSGEVNSFSGFVLGRLVPGQVDGSPVSVLTGHCDPGPFCWGWYALGTEECDF